MKRFVSLLVLLAFCVYGCAGMSPQRIAYNTLDDIAVAANQAMKAFNERYQGGLQTEEDRTKVLAAYATYQKGMLLAISLAKDVTQKQSALTVATDAVAPLLALIANLTPKKVSLVYEVTYAYA